MRDRLIQEIKAYRKRPERSCPEAGKKERNCAECGYNTEHGCNREARQADYLLSKGALMPQYKIGDTVYIILSKRCVAERVITGIRVDGCGEHIIVDDATFNVLDYGIGFFTNKKAAQKVFVKLYGPGSGTLCWECQRARALPGVACQWTKKAEPVPGWKAVKMDIPRANQTPLPSYRVFECPMFLQDEPRRKK